MWDVQVQVKLSMDAMADAIEFLDKGYSRADAFEIMRGNAFLKTAAQNMSLAKQLRANR